MKMMDLIFKKSFKFLPFLYMRFLICISKQRQEEKKSQRNTFFFFFVNANKSKNSLKECFHF